jgi:hypothetical protein
MITLGQHLLLHKIPIRSVPSEVVLHNKSIHNRSIHKRYQFTVYHKVPYQVVLHNISTHEYQFAVSSISSELYNYASIFNKQAIHNTINQSNIHNTYYNYPYL